MGGEGEGVRERDRKGMGCTVPHCSLPIYQQTDMGIFRHLVKARLRTAQHRTYQRRYNKQNKGGGKKEKKALRIITHRLFTLPFISQLSTYLTYCNTISIVPTG